MTRVLIVGKTIMKNQRCVGALGLNNNRSYRLLSAQGYNFPANTDFNIGQIWDLDLKAETRVKPPHTEDHRILRQRLVRTLSSPQIRRFLEDRVNAPYVLPPQLFDNGIRFTSRKKALVFQYGKVPPYSTGFWKFRRALHISSDEKGKARYLYCNNDSSCDSSDEDLVLDVRYVGCDAPPVFIPAGALLRFSLSRKYRAAKYFGYWLQLSGWFL